MPPGDNSCTIADVANGAENSLYFTSDMTVYDNETGMGNTTAGELYTNLLATYPYLPKGDNGTKRAMGLRIDGVVTGALALNRTLAKYPYSTKVELDYTDFKNELFNNIRLTDFRGMTGRVKLNAMGDRLANAIIYQIRGFTPVSLGILDTYLNQINWTQDLTFAGSSPPIDRARQVTNQQSVSIINASIVIALCAVGVVLTIVCMSTTHHYRHLKLIKLSSPNINNLMGFGCLLCYTSCIISAVKGCWNQSVTLCWAQSATLCLGYSVAYGAMLAKTWRVHAIFTSKNLRRVAIKDHHLVAVVAILATIDVVIFIVWGIVDPMWMTTLQFTVADSLLSGTIETNVIQSCTCFYSIIWICVFFVYKGLLLLFGIFFAWDTRSVHVESLNDSKKIGVCVYNTMVMGALGVVLSFVLPNSEINLRFLLINLCVAVCCSTAVIIVFGSKVVILIQHGPAKVDDLSNSLPGNESVVFQVSHNQTTGAAVSGGVALSSGV